MPDLQPIEEGNRIYRARGLFDVQLEVPEYSTLAQCEIDRILAIASWQGGDINDKVVDYEGGRAVTIERSIDAFDKGLEISGVGYAPPIIRGRTAMQGRRIVPPTPDNFYATEIGRTMRTAAVVNGQRTSQSCEYEPLGAYAEENMIDKILKTRTAEALRFENFHVGGIQAYGRHLSLYNEHGYAGFMVFSIPHPNMPRFAGYCSAASANNAVFVTNLGNAAVPLGEAARELHDKGFCHRQLHFSNFYFADYLWIMDWDTLQPLSQCESDSLMQRIIDIEIPAADLHAIITSLGAPIVEAGLISMGFLNEFLQGYFSDPDFDLFEDKEFAGSGDHYQRFVRLVKSRLP